MYCFAACRRGLTLGHMYKRQNRLFESKWLKGKTLGLSSQNNILDLYQCGYQLCPSGLTYSLPPLISQASYYLGLCTLSPSWCFKACLPESDSWLDDSTQCNIVNSSKYTTTSHQLPRFSQSC